MIAPLLSYANDGLMAVFFFVVGLEIKREMLFVAERAFREAPTLPATAKVGVLAASVIAGALGWLILRLTE